MRRDLLHLPEHKIKIQLGDLVIGNEDLLVRELRFRILKAQQRIEVVYSPQYVR